MSTRVDHSPDVRRSTSTRGQRKSTTCEHCDGEIPPTASHPVGDTCETSSGASSTIPALAMFANTASKVPSMSPRGASVASKRRSMPLICALRRAASTASGFTSSATTPAAPSLSAQSPRIPLPQPTSRTRSPPAIRSTSSAMICWVVGWRPFPNPPSPSSIIPGRCLRSCSDHAWQTLSRSSRAMGPVSRNHAWRAGPRSGLATAIAPSARSDTTRLATLHSSSAAANTTRRLSLGATTSIKRTPSDRSRLHTPASSASVVATAIITTRCHNSVQGHSTGPQAVRGQSRLTGTARI